MGTPSIKSGDPVGLTKSIRPAQFFSIGFGCIVGFGWIILLGEWLRQAGPVGASAAFAGGALVIVLLAFCYSELAGLVPVSGGEMAYAYVAFGLRAAYAIGWAIILFNIIAVSYVAISAGWILDYLIPSLRGPALYAFRGNSVHAGSLAVSFGVVLLLTSMNYAGIRLATIFQDVATYTKLGIAVVFTTAAVLGGRAVNLHPLVQADVTGSKWAGVLAVFVTTPWFYGGFNSIPHLIEEKSGGTNIKTLARVMLISVVVSGLFYCGVILAASMLVPWPTLVAMDLPTAAAFRQAFRSSIFANLVLIAGLLGTFTVGNACLLWGSRLVFALSRAQVISPIFAKINPLSRSPGRAILIVGAGSTCALLLGRQAIVPIVNVGGTCLALGYFVSAAAVMRLRKTMPGRSRPYRVPGGIVTTTLAAAAALLLCISSVYTPFYATKRWPLEWSVILGWAFLGWIIWVVARGSRSRVDELIRRKLILGNSL